MGHFQQMTNVGKNALGVKNGSCLQNSISSSEGGSYLAVSQICKRLMRSKCFAHCYYLYGINCTAKELWLFVFL